MSDYNIHHLSGTQVPTAIPSSKILKPTETDIKSNSLVLDKLSKQDDPEKADFKDMDVQHLSTKDEAELNGHDVDASEDYVFVMSDFDETSSTVINDNSELKQEETAPKEELSAGDDFVFDMEALSDDPVPVLDTEGEAPKSPESRIEKGLNVSKDIVDSKLLEGKSDSKVKNTRKGLSATEFEALLEIAQKSEVELTAFSKDIQSIFEDTSKNKPHLMTVTDNDGVTHRDEENQVLTVAVFADNIDELRRIHRVHSENNPGYAVRIALMESEEAFEAFAQKISINIEEAKKAKQDKETGSERSQAAKGPSGGSANVSKKRRIEDQLIPSSILLKGLQNEGDRKAKIRLRDEEHAGVIKREKLKEELKQIEKIKNEEVSRLKKENIKGETLSREVRKKESPERMRN